MYPKELLKKYKDSIEDYNCLMGMLGVIEIDKGKESVEYLEVQTRMEEIEKEMLDISKVFIESFI